MVEGVDVGSQTRELGDFDHQAKTTEGFLNNKSLNPKKSLTIKEKVVRLAVAATIAGAGILAYKGGLLNSAKFEGKDGSEGHSQNIDNIRHELQKENK